MCIRDSVEAGEAVKTWDFGAFHINMVGYQSQVIPAILVGLVFAVFYRFLKKRVPEMISMIVVPFCSLVPAVLLAHTVIGPFGRMIGDGLASIIMAGFSSSFSWLFSGIYGLLYPLLVITGLHHSMLPIDLQTDVYKRQIPQWPYATGGLDQCRKERLFNWREREMIKEPLPSGLWGKIKIIGLRQKHNVYPQGTP